MDRERGCEEMNLHFFTAPFCFHLVQGSRFRVQVAASPPFLEDGILVSQPSPLGNAIKLSGRTFLAPHRGGAARRAEGATQRYCMKVLEYR